jgi:hypothetical protein
MSDDEHTENECPICLIDYSDDDHKQLECPGNHKFHEICINAWLTGRNTCPICRTDVPGLPVSQTDSSDNIDWVSSMFNDDYPSHYIEGNDVIINGNFRVDGNVSVSGELIVEHYQVSRTYRSSDVIVTGNLIIMGNLSVSGSITARSIRF